MIGDRLHDVEGAARYGIPTAIVRWGYGSPGEWDGARWSPADTTELERIVHEW
ncbi:MAG: HAD hydrolase-like protein [Dietzia sp.]